MVDKLPKATHTGELKIGDIRFECAVLENGMRIISETRFMETMGMYRSGALSVRRKSESAPIPLFLAHKNLKPFADKHLGGVHFELTRYQNQRGRTARGIPAEIMPKVCEVWIDARNDGVLGHRQQITAEIADTLLRGFAHVGIIALVDEATGYERIREERALATILEKFIDKELQPWTKTFPYEFYEQIYRLKGWPGPDGHKRTPLIGRYTNDLVYDRLAPGVLQALKKRNPTLPSGRRKTTHHQWFTPDLGHPKLKEHLAAVMALMRASPNWDRFMANLNRAFKSKNKQRGKIE